MRETWQVERTRRRIEFLKSLDLEIYDVKDNAYGKIQTDGGNIFLRAYRVGLFSDERTHRIRLLYNQYGDNITAIDPERLEIVLEFKKLLDEKQIPYDEAPTRREAREILLEDRKFLDGLISKMYDSFRGLDKDKPRRKYSTKAREEKSMDY